MKGYIVKYFDTTNPDDKGLCCDTVFLKKEDAEQYLKVEEETCEISEYAFLIKEMNIRE